METNEKHNLVMLTRADLLLKRSFYFVPAFLLRLIVSGKSVVVVSISLHMTIDMISVCPIFNSFLFQVDK